MPRLSVTSRKKPSKVGREAALEAKYRERRRGVRMNSRVPVAIEWEGDGEEKFREEANTRVIGLYGCLAVLRHNLPMEQRVQLTNLWNGQTNPAVVAWKGAERAEGWELGLELIDPDVAFWGLEL